MVAPAEWAHIFQRLTGFAIAAPIVDALPARFLARPAPSPSEALNLPIRSRTDGVLRRFLATESEEGPWTFGRLVRLPGLGFGSLLDLLHASQSQDRPSPSPALLLEEELRHLGPGRPTPLFDRAVAAIASRLPATPEELAERLIARGLASSPIQLGALVHAARRLKRRLPFTTLRREGLTVVVSCDTLERASLVHRLAMRASQHAGAMTVSSIAYQAEVSPEFVVALLTARRGFRWLDQKRGWFWLGNQRSPLLAVVDDLLELSAEIPAEEVVEDALERLPAEAVPPASVMATLCAQTGRFAVAGGVIRPGGSRRIDTFTRAENVRSPSL